MPSGIQLFEYSDPPVPRSSDDPAGLMLAGPFDSADELDALIDALRLQSLPLAMTRLREWLIIRYLGDSAFSARQAFVHAWAQVRPALLQRPACAPRIWAT